MCRLIQDDGNVTIFETFLTFLGRFVFCFIFRVGFPILVNSLVLRLVMLSVQWCNILHVFNIPRLPRFLCMLLMMAMLQSVVFWGPVYASVCILIVFTMFYYGLFSVFPLCYGSCHKLLLIIYVNLSEQVFLHDWKSQTAHLRGGVAAVGHPSFIFYSLQLTTLYL